jgi:hypothetical protein
MCDLKSPAQIMKWQRGTVQEYDPDINQTTNTIKDTEVYYSYTQSRWFYCFSMRAPPSHLAHLPPLFSELLTDNVIRASCWFIRCWDRSYTSVSFLSRVYYEYITRTQPARWRVKNVMPTNCKKKKCYKRKYTTNNF